MSLRWLFFSISPYINKRQAFELLAEKNYFRFLSPLKEEAAIISNKYLTIIPQPHFPIHSFIQSFILAKTWGHDEMWKNALAKQQNLPECSEPAVSSVIVLYPPLEYTAFIYP